jgi:endoglucanase
MLTAVVGGCATAQVVQFPATSFIAGYVRPDGRVARPDQGDDTVSEGQAYGLLLAEAAGKPALFGRIWQWTHDHLQLPNGLFAYHANAAGRLLSTEPASDADLLIAWALLRYQGPDAASRHQAGQRVAAAVLAREVTSGPGGAPVLTGGPWATGDPASLNPSYWALPALTGLAQLTGDARWQQLADEAVMLTNRLTDGGRKLPPDWAQLTAKGALTPIPAPDGSETQAEYGLDAQRTILWFAASCDPRARTLAGRWWALLQRPGRSRALALKLNGRILNPETSPLPLAAAAAAAQAAGQQGVSSRLLQSAAVQQYSYRTYYGGAWAALAPVLLNGTLDSTCTVSPENPAPWEPLFTKTQLPGLSDCLQPASRPELEEDRPDVSSHGGVADVQEPGHGPVVSTLGHEGENLPFPPRQAV